jgi:hypothetical protein
MSEPTTVIELRNKLRQLGISGYSGKNKEELVKMYNQSRPNRESKSPQKKAKISFDLLFDNATIDKFRKLTGINSDVLITKQSTLLSKTKKKEFVLKLDNDLCEGLEDYLLNALKRAHEPAVYGPDPDADIVMDYVYILNEEKEICSILIAHKGECAKRFDHELMDEVTTDKPLWGWWTVRLICNRNSPGCKGNASKLLGAYCYALKSKKIQSHGLLEVAGDYDNIAGYCLYSKYGFVESDFPCDSFEWLQLATNLKNIKTKEIIQTVVSGKKSINDTGSTLYCEELKSVSRFNTDRIETELKIPRWRYDPAFIVTPIPEEPEIEEKSCAIM